MQKWVGLPLVRPPDTDHLDTDLKQFSEYSQNKG